MSIDLKDNVTECIATAALAECSRESPTATTAAVTAPREQRSKAPAKVKRRRIENAGLQVLRDYYNHRSKRPNAKERREIAAEINAIPKCEWYTVTNVERWFNNKRSIDRRAEAKTRASDSPSSTYDTALSTSSSKPGFLSQYSVSKLEELVKAEPDPPLAVVKLLAEVLKIDPKACMDWVDTYRANQNPKEEPDSVQLHLPTPEPSASPPIGRTQTLPPLSPPPPPAALAPLSIGLPIERWHPSLGQAVANQPPPPVFTPVASLQEFEAQFGPHYTQMLGFLSRVNDGEYAALGLLARAEE